MKEFVEYLVKNLVDHPDQVKVDLFEGTAGLLVELRVAQEDVGKVIGRAGNTIKSIRTIVATVCAKLGKKMRLELIEQPKT